MTIAEFEHIAQQLRPQLQAIGRRFFADRARADDVAQEVLMRLWLMRNRVSYSPGTEALATRMAKNYCINTWRREQRMVTAGDLPDIPAATNHDQAELSHFLQLAIDSLPLSERRLFRMRYEWDMGIEEISAVMGIAPRSVSSMVSTAKRKLKEKLEKGGFL